MKTYEEILKAQARINDLKSSFNETMVEKFFQMNPEYTPEENEYFELQKEVKEFLDTHQFVVLNHLGERLNRFATEEEAQAYIEVNKPNDWFTANALYFC